jgi:uncharacterized membrane protein
MIAKRPSGEFVEIRDRVLFPDLALIIAWVLATAICISTPLLRGTPLPIIFGLPFVLFIPGYALVTALFPGREDLDLIERLALSFGTSIAVVPLIGLVLNYTPWGIRLTPIVASLALFTAAMAAVAQVRRSRLPAEDRFTLPLRDLACRARSELFSPGQSGPDRLMSILLLMLIVVGIVTAVYSIAVPAEGEPFTEFYVLNESGKVAGYPERFAADDPRTVIIGIGNHENRNVAYTVETWLYAQAFDPATNTSTVHECALMDRWTVTLPHDETSERPYAFTANSTGYNRVEFLLFEGQVPAESTIGAARINESMHDLHIWIGEYGS